MDLEWFANGISTIWSEIILRITTVLPLFPIKCLCTSLLKITSQEFAYQCKIQISEAKKSVLYLVRQYQFYTSAVSGDHEYSVEPFTVAILHQQHNVVILSDTAPKTRGKLNIRCSFILRQLTRDGAISGDCFLRCSQLSLKIDTCCCEWADSKPNSKLNELLDGERQGNLIGLGFILENESVRESN